MAKLIVEEGGRRRAFRMGQGVLTVGSGAEARLRLASADVAEVHLELELTGDPAADPAGTVRLRPRPGVVPPRVDGRPASGEVVLAPGRPVEVGSARLWIEDEGAAPPAAATAGADESAPSAGPPPVQRPAARGRERVRAPRRTVERSKVPSWLFVVLVLAGVGIAILVYSRGMTASGAGEGLAQQKVRAARQAFAAARFDDARAELAGIPADALTPELVAERSALERDISDALAADALREENEAGTRFLDTLLKKYEGLYLQGEPDRAKVRLFLQRCRTFRERWPRHPEMDWVDRQERRFDGYVDMQAPLTLADVEWQVKYLVEGMPRDYVSAFALVDEFLARADGVEREAAQALHDRMSKERPEHAQDRLFQARHEYEKKGDPSKAVWWLVHNVAWLGDPALADESARYLLRMPDVQGHLRAYHRNYPEKYAAVMANEVVAAWARETGFAP